ncbi:helix-turn-helix domain-containing protein [Cohnella thailandensis]|uniref:Helix-turn-helix transcriptional regulator n=1 Tax=Cohnella thailandensis TaxID=557557 RepID=A0A841T4K0_9BACL|nr:helix-turn-helix transcriptional regulator [Cohnella thailandensis]MBB6636787.1 helix-turn-helix transcriptional regulator [Cohnella thailandensis]MBP1973336.1 transcriptional regulator with XRE-family HTH domain [Cohnella thailandensis]
MNMGERLRELRLKRNISQEEVARHIGITRSAYSHYEINNRQPIYETLIKLAAYFDVSLDYIIGGNSPSQSNMSYELPDATDSKEILMLLRGMNHEQRKQSLGLLHEMMKKDGRANGSG